MSTSNGSPSESSKHFEAMDQVTSSRQISSKPRLSHHISSSGSSWSFKIGNLGLRAGGHAGHQADVATDHFPGVTVALPGVHVVADEEVRRVGFLPRGVTLN